MKVIHIIGGLDPSGGGPAQIVIGLNKFLNKKGIESIIWTTNAGYIENLDVPLKQNITYNGSNVIFYPYSDNFFIRKINKLYYSGLFANKFYLDLCRNINQYDIVHIHGFYSFFQIFSSRLATFKKKSYIITPQGSIIKDLIFLKSRFYKERYIKFFGKKILENAIGLHCLTHYEKKEIEKFGFKIKNYFHIPSGIDPNDFKCLPPKGLLFEKYPNLRGKKIILFFSRISFKKGLDTLISSLAKITKSKKDVHLLLVGADNEGYIRTVNKWIDNYGINDFVSYVGLATGKDKLMYLQDSDMFVLPSYSENYGLSVIEAIYMGLPVVVTENVGVAEYIRRCGAGYVTKKDDQMIIKSIIHLCNNPMEAKEMGKKGKIFVEENLLWNQIVEGMIKVYHDILVK